MRVLRDFAAIGLVMVVALLASASGALAALNGRLAFECSDQNKVGICTVNPDAFDRALILDDVEREPAWSPDGTRIAFTYEERGESEYTKWIGTVRADGSDRRDRIVEGHSPAWTPDGRLSYIDWDGNGDLWVADPDGSNRQRLTTDGLRGGRGVEGNGSWTDVTYALPAWSPDGRYVAVLRSVQHVTRSEDTVGIFQSESYLWTLTPDGSVRWRISPSQPKPELSYLTGPGFWLPDATLVYRLSADDGYGAKVDYFRARADGSDARPVEAPTGFARVSPDGRRLAYVRWLEGPGGGALLTTACLDGSNAEHVPGFDVGLPDWQPLEGSRPPTAVGPCPDPAGRLRRRATVACGRETCRLRMRGSLRLPDTLLRPLDRADACDGRVTAEVFDGSRLRGRLRATVRNGCRFSGRVRWRPQGEPGLLTLRLRHAGSSWLLPAEARPLRVRLQHPR